MNIEKQSDKQHVMIFKKNRYSLLFHFLALYHNGKYRWKKVGEKSGEVSKDKLIKALRLKQKGFTNLDL